MYKNAIGFRIGQIQCHPDNCGNLLFGTDSVSIGSEFLLYQVFDHNNTAAFCAAHKFTNTHPHNTRNLNAQLKLETKNKEHKNW